MFFNTHTDRPIHIWSGNVTYLLWQRKPLPHIKHIQIHLNTSQKMINKGDIKTLYQPYGRASAMPPTKGHSTSIWDMNSYTWMFSLLRDNSYRFMKLKLQTSSGDYFVWHFVFYFHSTWFLSILAEFGWFCWCDFGRTDFWRVKRRQMRLSWKFSLLNRYFSTTVLYQFFPTRQYVTSSLI